MAEEVKEEKKELTPEQLGEQTLKEMARLQGWVPKEEYRGDPKNWRDFKEFLDVGERIQPILKERNRALTEQISELKKTIEQFASHYKRVSETAYEKALADIKAAQAAAVKDGDVEAYSKLEEQRGELEKSKPADVTVQPTSPPGFAEFKDANPWYDMDMEMTIYADEVGKRLFAKDTNRPIGPWLYDRVEEEIKKKFPERFGKKPEEKVEVKPQETVEGGGFPPGHDAGIPGKKTYDNLPTDAKAECDRFVKEGLLTREDYVKDYEWGE